MTLTLSTTQISVGTGINAATTAVGIAITGSLAAKKGRKPAIYMVSVT
jgi:hypothetical protein